MHKADNGCISVSEGVSCSCYAKNDTATLIIIAH
jgi:hypothetical protein